jgi:hypothetical protein
LYVHVTPPLELGLPFLAGSMRIGYFDWVSLPHLFPTSFPGVKTSRDEFLVEIDRSALERRIADYFNPHVSNEDIRDRYPQVMTPSDRFDPITTRAVLLKRGPKLENFVRYSYRPFDLRWLYWEPETKLLDEKRSDYRHHAIAGNVFIEAREKEPKDAFNRGTLVSGLADNFGNGLSTFFPRALNNGKGFLGPMNLPKPVADFAAHIGAKPDEVFGHVISIIHAPAYRVENLGALRMDWPRIPIPRDPERLKLSADLGETLRLLIDPEASAPGVSTGLLRVGLQVMGLPTKRRGAALASSDLELTAGWGSTQKVGGGTIVMPGRGFTRTRDYTNAERAAFQAEAQTLGMSLEELFSLIGHRTLDVYLNPDAWWANVPEKVWEYTLGGHQIIKKWLSYRESSVLRRALSPDEAKYVSEMVRRIAAVLTTGPMLDVNYRICADDAQTYEQLGLSREASRERRDAKIVKRGISKKLTPAMQPAKKRKLQKAANR